MPVEAWRGRLGMAWRGGARHGRAGRGRAWQAWQGMVRYGLLVFITYNIKGRCAYGCIPMEGREPNKG